MAFLYLGHGYDQTITPKAFNRHHFILVAIDYFTKWVKATLYAKFTKSIMCKLVKWNIICRYGFPKQIIIYNARNLNKKIQAVCS